MPFWFRGDFPHVLRMDLGHASQVASEPAQETTAPPVGAIVLRSRADLRRRWAKLGVGRDTPSDATFWRWEKAKLLVPRRWEGSLGYAWEDVWRFEGGLPPKGMEDAYRQDLIGSEDVAALSPISSGAIERLAKSGRLPSRQVGRARLFVPAEICCWLTAWY
jgi:hypothetical protein